MHSRIATDLQVFDMPLPYTTLEVEQIRRILILPCLLEFHLLFLGYATMFVCEKQRGDGLLPDATLRVWGIRGQVQPR